MREEELKGKWRKLSLPFFLPVELLAPPTRKRERQRHNKGNNYGDSMLGRDFPVSSQGI